MRTRCSAASEIASSNLKLERAERLALKGNADLVLAQVERWHARAHHQHLAQRKDHRAGGHLVGAQHRAVAQIDRQAGARHRAAVDRDTLNVGNLGVAEPVLDRELDALLDVFQAAECVELLEQHARNK
jgi:hypothetical protein